MATLVRMPQKGLSEETALLSKWYVKKGDEVKEGQYLFALETGKATFDVEAEVSGTVLEIFGEEGDEVAVTAVVCVIGSPGESYSLDPAETAGGAPAEEAGPAAPAAPVAPTSAAAPSTPAAAPAAAPAVQVAPAAPVTPAAPAAPAAPSAAAAPVATPAVQAAPAASVIPAAPAASEGRLKVSPRARRLAREKGLALEGIAGSGPGGRIIADDVQAALAAGLARPAAAAASPAAPGAAEAAGEYSAIPNDRMRKTIAVNMLRSLQGMAQFTMGTSFDATELLSYRERYNAVHSGEEKLSINDLILFAVSRVILDFPFMNAHYYDEETRHFVHASIGVAVDTPRGLLVPTVKMADELSLAEISARVKELALRSREGKAGMEDLSGGTFTISNIGAAGVDFFTPVINPPQTGILGVGGIEYKRKKTAQGMEDYPAIVLSLTVDHRAVDGAPAARFLQTLVKELENFPLLLVK